MSDQILDSILWVAHMVVITFNLTGWIWRATKRWHLIVILSTLASWFILGIWYGLGYCFLTDWHWNLKYRLGESELPNSFITYLLNNQLGMNLDELLIDWGTGLATGIAVIMSIIKNRDIFLKKRDI